MGLAWQMAENRYFSCLPLNHLTTKHNILFYQQIKSLLLGMNCVIQHQDLQKFDLKLNRYE